MEIVLIIAFLGAMFMGVSIGASSVPPAFAPVVGSSKGLRLALIGGISAFAGALIQGQNVTNTIGSGILTGQIQVIQAAFILVVASLLVMISVLNDYPMPTAFTVTGAVIGSGFGFGNEIIWSSTRFITLFWVLTPLAAFTLGYAFAHILRSALSKEGSEKVINALLLIAGCYVAYTAGAASVGLAVGPLGGLGHPIIYLLIFGGVSILIGAWMFSPRIIHVISYDYSNIGPRRSIAALIAAGLIAQIGIQLGVPVSFGLAIIPAVIGSGVAEGMENKNTRKIGFTILAWVAALFLAMLLTFALGVLWKFI
ncbi:MAG: anion permease [Hadesarchaea archaeon]|nr:anion permease [Hadesarchaea archaeon]